MIKYTLVPHIAIISSLPIYETNCKNTKKNVSLITFEKHFASYYSLNSSHSISFVSICPFTSS